MGNPAWRVKQLPLGNILVGPSSQALEEVKRGLEDFLPPYTLRLSELITDVIPRAAGWSLPEENIR